MSYSPTGRRRHRIERRGWLGRRYMVVLQVEITGSSVELIGGHVDRVYRTYWRDAQLEDVEYIRGANYGDHRLYKGRV